MRPVQNRCSSRVPLCGYLGLHFRRDCHRTGEGKKKVFKITGCPSNMGCMKNGKLFGSISARANPLHYRVPRIYIRRAPALHARWRELNFTAIGLEPCRGKYLFHSDRYHYDVTSIYLMLSTVTPPLSPVRNSITVSFERWMDRNDKSTYMKPVLVDRPRRNSRCVQ